MANTLKKIQTVIVGSGGAANIDFTNIPQTYTDLKIVYSLRSNDTNANGGNFFYFQFNNTGFTGLSAKALGGNGSSIFNTSGNVYGFMNPSDFTASVFSNGEFYIPSYTSANNKSYYSDSANENNATAANMVLYAGLWSNTAAVTSIKLVPYSGSFVEYSEATLYGVSNASNTSVGAYATGGNQIYTDNTYWYHVFTSSGTFTPARSLTADYLVIAGGGGGGGNFAGGGGAGGARCTVGATGGGGSLETPLSLTAQAYTVTVGAGGPGDSGSGTNSVFGSITSTAGGLGGGGTAGGDTPGNAGGSGGGGGGVNGNVNQNPNSGGTRTASPVQGNNGGVGRFNRVAGGGGGAGAVGGSASGTTAGAGGNGITTSISGTSTTYAGGGGGGSLSPTGNGNSGGTGGGGNGTNSGAVSGSGTANTGSGGGGGPGNGSGGAGGSGIVIVRYTV